jgi:predicted O-methyltransferase YrrM
MNPGEIEALVALISTVNHQTVVEIGVNVGLTAKGILDNLPDIITYTGIDVNQGYVPACEAQRREVPKSPGHLAMGDFRFQLMMRDRGSLDLLPDEIGKCNVMFIDGDHGKKAVEWDTALARSCVLPGGLIIWHDYVAGRGVDVQGVLDGFYTAGNLKLACIERTWLAFERVE